ncbi:MAG: CsiV family protein [Proteobacteria bacterium]|nr:CsiV family protein [Pseudomonadota bacterium]MDA1064837.1 CsiV family protein [Pseudomonadota bacterium]
MIEAVQKSMLLLLATLLPAMAVAQDEILDELQPEIRLYTLELVVFSHTEEVSGSNEIFPPDTIEPATEDPDFVAELEVLPLKRRHPDYVGLAPVVLPEDQLTMQDVIEQLELLDAYEPLMHIGWTQPGYAQSDQITMPLATFGAVPPELQGSFTLYAGRYLHLVVDLALTAPAAAAEYADESGAVHEFEYTLPPVEGPVRFRIQEDRILKNGEIRYFDHPKFGVVAKVMRVESATE